MVMNVHTNHCLIAFIFEIKGDLKFRMKSLYIMIHVGIYSDFILFYVTHGLFSIVQYSSAILPICLSNL